MPLSLEEERKFNLNLKILVSDLGDEAYREVVRRDKIAAQRMADEQLDQLAAQFRREDVERIKHYGNKFPRVLGEKPPTLLPSQPPPPGTSNGKEGRKGKVMAKGKTREKAKV